MPSKQVTAAGAARSTSIKPVPLNSKPGVEHSPATPDQRCLHITNQLKAH
jgi:hypothetical protein